MSRVTVTVSHNHMSRQKIVEGFGKMMLYSMLYTWSFRIG